MKIFLSSNNAFANWAVCFCFFSVNKKIKWNFFSWKCSHILNFKLKEIEFKVSLFTIESKSVSKRAKIQFLPLYHSNPIFNPTSKVRDLFYLLRNKFILATKLLKNTVQKFKNFSDKSILREIKSALFDSFGVILVLSIDQDWFDIKYNWKGNFLISTLFLKIFPWCVYPYK